jgi:glutathione S-transferase
MGLNLVIGDKKWSSWSLRPWIALNQANIPFDEIMVPLRRPDTKAQILRYSASGKIPALINGDHVIWDSLAILNTLPVLFPGRAWWPSESAAFCMAQSIAAEIHAGFPAIRNTLPMDIGLTLPTPDLSAETLAELDRIESIWRTARTRFGADGPFLFGKFSNADAMFAPVATRLRTYGISLGGLCDDYVDAILMLPGMIAWYAAAAEERARDTPRILREP